MTWRDYVQAAAGAIMLAAALWALTLVALLQWGSELFAVRPPWRTKKVFF